MKFDGNRHGRGSKLDDAWARAAAMNREHPGPQGSEWVPWVAVWVRDGIGPRGVNRETVAQYAEAFADLPPIEVQRDTFTLIDGRHRLEAAPVAGSDLIRIREIDIDDGDLAERAFLANLNHGLPYALSERVQGLRMLLDRHPDWSNSKLVRMLGLSYETVAKYRSQIQRGADRDQRLTENRIVERRTGLDGRTINVGNIGRAPVRSFDPGPDPYRDDEQEYPAYVVVPTERITSRAREDAWPVPGEADGADALPAPWPGDPEPGVCADCGGTGELEDGPCFCSPARDVPFPGAEGVMDFRGESEGWTVRCIVTRGPGATRKGFIETVGELQVQLEELGVPE